MLFERRRRARTERTFVRSCFFFPFNVKVCGVLLIDELEAGVGMVCGVKINLSSFYRSQFPHQN